MFDTSLLSMGEVQDGQIEFDSLTSNPVIDAAADGSIRLEYSNSVTIAVVNAAGSTLESITGIDARVSRISPDGEHIFVDPSNTTIDVYEDIGSTGTWAFEQTIDITTIDPGYTRSSNQQTLNICVNTTGDILMIGIASGSDYKVQVWTRSGSVWTHDQNIAGYTASDRFGSMFSKTMTDDRVVISNAPTWVNSSLTVTHYVYKLTTGTWGVEQAITTLSKGDPGHYPPVLDSIGGATLCFMDELDGSIKVYTRSGTTWTNTSTTTSSLLIQAHGQAGNPDLTQFSTQAGNNFFNLYKIENGTLIRTDVYYQAPVTGKDLPEFINITNADLLIIGKGKFNITTRTT